MYLFEQLMKEKKCNLEEQITKSQILKHEIEFGASSYAMFISIFTIFTWELSSLSWQTCRFYIGILCK